MAIVLITVIVILTLALVAVVLIGLRLLQRQYLRDELSPVSRQHIDLFQGGQLSESAVESAKARFRELLERGEMAAVEASLRAGMQYVVQVRALAELGTDEAGRVLERQLQRRLTDDQIEQSWYWIDLANGLRSLNRSQALPHLLRCAEAAGETPLGNFFAAETVCFLGFAGYLRQTSDPLGRAALRVLHRALEGLCFGVPGAVVVEGRVGEMIETLWDHCREPIDPLAVRVFAVALRVLRRAPAAETLLGVEAADREAFGWQVSRLAALEPTLADYLREAPVLLRRRLETLPTRDHLDVLRALADLRADATDVLLPMLSEGHYPHLEAAVDVLAWSTSSRVAPWLRQYALGHLPLVGRAQARRRSAPPRRPSVPGDVPYRAILRALQNHASPQTEAFLLLASRDWDPTYRAGAVSSLGWWEPMSRAEVLNALQEARRDPSPEVRHSARAALARLGERQALQWFRQSLTSEDTQRVFETIQAIATENLTLLWPDLDRLADSEDGDVAHHAREALARLSEEMDRRRG
jgi:HEAT repeat protein